MNLNFRNFALWVIIILLVVAVVMLFQGPGQRVPSQDIAFSQLLNEVYQAMSARSRLPAMRSPAIDWPVAEA